MKICIVGGTGNISQYLTPILLDQGHDVTLYNRGQRGTAPTGAHVILGDRQDRPAFEAAMQAAKFDLAIDFICFNREDALSDLRAFAGVQHLIHISTVMTYGLELLSIPATEDHPLRCTAPYGVNKNAADATFLAAHYRDGFPVTIAKPSCTLGGTNGPRRMITREHTWLDRIRRGKPLLIVNDGMVMYQFLHSHDAAHALAHMLGSPTTIGQTYNLTQPGFTWWRDHHLTAMQILGREVEFVSITMQQLAALEVPAKDACLGNYGHHSYHAVDKLQRDIPQFTRSLCLKDTLADVIQTLEQRGDIPDATTHGLWEDQIIAKARRLVDA